MAYGDMAPKPDPCAELTTGKGWLFPWRLALFIWSYIISPFLPLFDVVTDILTVISWHDLCSEDKLECFWWPLGILFCILPTLILWSYGSYL